MLRALLLTDQDLQDYPHQGINTLLEGFKDWASIHFVTTTTYVI
jgi:hypothetical protein